MNYIILAAGKGSRMGDLNRYLQKCMYPVLDKPFVEYILMSLTSTGLFIPENDAIVLVVGHKKEQIQDYFGNSWNSIPLQYATQPQALGTAQAVKIGIEAGDPTASSIIIQGDVWADPAFFRSIIQNPLDNALSIVHHECHFEHNERVDVQDGLITNAWKGRSSFVECGIWKFSPLLGDFMMSKKVDEYRALPAVQNAIESGVKVAAVERKDWVHLGGTEPSVQENLKTLYNFSLTNPNFTFPQTGGNK